MTLDRNSRIVRWAYFTDDYCPSRTSLCALFWRCVLWTPVRLIAAAVIIGGIVGGALFLAVKLWPLTLVIAGIVAAPGVTP